MTLYSRYVERHTGRRPWVSAKAKDKIEQGLTLVAGMSSHPIALADYLVFVTPLMGGRGSFPPIDRVLQAAPKLAGPFHAHVPLREWSPQLRVPGTEKLHEAARASLYWGAALPADWDALVADAVQKKAQFVAGLAETAANGGWVWTMPTVGGLVGDE